MGCGVGGDWDQRDPGCLEALYTLILSELHEEDREIWLLSRALGVVDLSLRLCGEYRGMNFGVLPCSPWTLGVAEILMAPPEQEADAAVP